MSKLRRRKEKHEKVLDQNKSDSIPEKRRTESMSFFSWRYWYVQHDASYLAVFRVLWGCIMAFEAYSFLLDDFEKVTASFYKTQMNFKNYGFEWCIVPQNPFYIKLLVVVLLVLSVLIAIGLLYRLSAVLFFFGFLYLMNLEAALNLNHFYLVLIMSLLMICLPCNCYFSIDSLLFPSVYSSTAPRWCLWIVRIEFIVVYTYAGVAKINEDWLRAEPMRAWISTRVKLPSVGRYMTQATAYFLAYGGLFYDLLVGPMLLFGWTRWLAVLLSLFFHLSNKILFNIGVFPWIMIASTTFFFDPSTPRWFICQCFGFNFKPRREERQVYIGLLQKALLIFLAAFLLHQILVPLRHLQYPGDVAWNEYGHLYSWRMKLRTKKCDLIAIAYDSDEQAAFVIPLHQIMNTRQYWKMASRPDLIIQLAHFIRDNALKQKPKHLKAVPEVYMDCWCELNGRPYQQFVNHTINLSSETPYAYPYSWVTDLKPLPLKLKDDFPWNWSWTFNWFKGKHPPYIPAYLDQNNRKRRGEQMQEHALKVWREMLTQKYGPEVVIVGEPSPIIN